MKKSAFMGIENEFSLVSSIFGTVIPGTQVYQDILHNLSVPYFERGEYSVRLATGGAFYVDGAEPEVTSAPYLLDKNASTALAVNLILNRNAIVEGLRKFNQQTGRKYQLNGYSAHYNFTFPNINPANLTKELALTVNPALQLLLENRHSSGIMFRYRDNNRLEICADYIPGLEDLVCAIGFQAAMLSTIDSWMEEGITAQDLERNLKYRLPNTQLQSVATRTGYILKTPEVIKKGRKAKIDVVRYDGRNISMHAQELLEHFCEMFTPAMEVTLSDEEKSIVFDSVQNKRYLPIDHRGFPNGYHNVKAVNVDARLAYAPLTEAFAKAVKNRELGEKVSLTPTAITWENIAYDITIDAARTERNLVIPFDCVVGFEIAIEKDPSIVKRLAKGKLTEQDMLIFRDVGIATPALLVTDRTSEDIDLRYRLRIPPRYGELPFIPSGYLNELRNRTNNLIEILSSHTNIIKLENKKIYRLDSEKSIKYLIKPELINNFNIDKEPKPKSLNYILNNFDEISDVLELYSTPKKNPEIKEEQLRNKV